MSNDGLIVFGSHDTKSVCAKVLKLLLAQIKNTITIISLRIRKLELVLNAYCVVSRRARHGPKLMV
jgi:hypothetical protein